jgi:hypothetical protein
MPEQNGIAERKHRHVVEKGLALLDFFGLTRNFLLEAFATTTYLINHMPIKITNRENSKKNPI